MVEGLAPYASRQAFIYRSNDDGSSTEIPVQLHKILARKSPDVALRADDILYVPDSTGKRITLSALEKVGLYGSTMTAAALYAGLK
jgi:polysaccharide biosynthesis/export protein